MNHDNRDEHTNQKIAESVTDEQNREEQHPAQGRDASHMLSPYDLPEADHADQ